MNTSKMLIMLIFFTGCLTLSSCSDSDNSVTAPPVIDTSPPAIPTGLTTCTGDCVVKLSWDPNNVDSDLKGFHVYRLNDDQTWVLTMAPTSNSYFVDCDPVLTQCLYRVTAVDIAGNESGWAETAYICQYNELDYDRP